MKVKRYPYTDADGVLHIRYQDKYTFGSTVSEIREERITSTVAGTDQRDERLLVPQADGKSVYADGCGTATVLLADGEVRIKVDPSPINILFVTGQSNASGDPAGGLKPGYAEQYTRDYIRSPETMAYLTWTGQRVSVDVEQDKADYRWAWENGGTLWPSDPPESVRFVDYK
ncbi:MAG: hypothetical protein IIW19_06415, partial [Clostridia bacterium]|nr:hypothetical protein [Clostridia bacterium]